MWRALTGAAVAALALPAHAQAIPTCDPAPEMRTIAEGQGRLESITSDARGRLFYTDLTNDRLLRVDRPGAQPTVLATGISRPGNIVLEPSGTMLVGFNDRNASGVPGNGGAGITRVDPETGAKAPFVSGIDQANGIVRTADGTVYASNNIAGEIVRIAPDGNVERHWLDMDSPNGLVLDSNGTHMYAAQTFTPAKIGRIELASAKLEPYFAPGPEDTAAGLDGITRDAANRLFVAANGAGEVWRVGPDGEACALARGLGLPSAVGFGGGEPGFPEENLYVVTFSGRVIELARTTESPPTPPPATTPAQLHLKARPLRPRANRRTRLRFSVTSRGLPVPGATVGLRRRTARTDERGRAKLTLRLRRGLIRVRATRPGFRTDVDRLRVR